MDQRDPACDGERLAEIDLFRDLPPETLMAIARACTPRRFRAQEQVFDRDSANADVFGVIEGRVRIVNYSLSGREITFDELLPGACFGEIAAIDGQPRSASVVAIERSLLLAIPRHVFLDVLAGHAQVARRVMERMARIIRAADDRIMDLSTVAAHNRVHAEILRQARGCRESGSTARLSPIPLHGDIASRVSTTRETVARAMNDLARRGIVERRKDALVVRDLDALEALVDDVRG